MRFDFALELSGVRKGVAIQFFADGVENLACGFYSKVCREQRGLQILEDRGINLALTEKNRVNRFRERRLRLADGLLQLLKKRWFRLVFAKQGDHTVAHYSFHATSDCNRYTFRRSGRAYLSSTKRMGGRYTWTSTALRRSLPCCTADSSAVTTMGSNFEPARVRMRSMAKSKSMAVW